MQKFKVGDRVKIREDIRKLLEDKLSDTLTAEQKNNRVKNLLQSMKKRGVIEIKEFKVRKTIWSLKSKK